MPEVGSERYDICYKIRPFIEMLNEKFNKIPMTENLSVDEMMIPYSGTRGSRHFVRGKPNPWGFKAYTLCDTFGIVYNIHLASGPFPRVPGLPDIRSMGNRVLDLCSIIPSHKNHKVYMDSYFSMIAIALEVKKRRIHDGYMQACTSTRY